MLNENRWIDIMLTVQSKDSALGQDFVLKKGLNQINRMKDNTYQVALLPEKKPYMVMPLSMGPALIRTVFTSVGDGV